MDKRIRDELDKGNINHAYFFECEDEKEIEEFSQEVLKCKLENNPDYKVIRSEDGKQIKVDQIRELQKDVLIKPLKCDKKIYFIPQADKLNLASQNCLLKTLEEPPPYAIIILEGTSIYSVIGTIRSRVKRIKVSTMSEQAISEDIKHIIDELHTKNKVDVLNYFSIFEKNKEKIFELLNEMTLYCEKCIQYAQNGLSAEKYNDIIKYGKYISIINSTELRLKENANFSMILDKMLLDMRG